jgi:hypothetical protein
MPVNSDGRLCVGDFREEVCVSVAHLQAEAGAEF